MVLVLENKEEFYPSIIEEAINSLSLIPSYGEKVSKKLFYSFMKLSHEEREKILEALKISHSNLRICKECFLLTDQEDSVCTICKSPKRTKNYILVVEESIDAYKIEKLGRYKGVYHVLMGRIAPLEGLSVEDIKINELLIRIKKYSPKEIIIGTNPTPEGEATANYLLKIIKKEFKVKVSRIANALQFGSLIEYVDEISLQNSIINRIEKD